MPVGNGGRVDTCVRRILARKILSQVAAVVRVRDSRLTAATFSVFENVCFFPIQ